jgi:hypothetical protein
MIKIDLHIHSKYSYDCFLEPKIIIKIAKKRNLDGVAITDHNSLKGSTEVKKIAKDFLIVSGVEIKTLLGEILAYGIQEEIKPEQNIFETIDKIHEQGGIAIAPHPFDLFRKYSGKNIVKGIDGVEVFNSRCTLNYFNYLAVRKAKEMNLSMIAGSDAHIIEEIGKAFTKFDSDGDIIKMIKKGLCYPEGKLSLPIVHLKLKLLKFLKS